MSGHNKWSKIAGKKAVADQKRSGQFTKIIKNIIVAAKGGADLETNFKLRLAVDKARAANMPKDNIDRAIARGAGTADGGQIEEVIYEGFGPGGVAILVLTNTDNRNRTSSDLKHIFSKYNGAMGGPNSVKWMFEHKGIIRIDQVSESEELQLELIDNGAEDVEVDDKGMTVITTFDNFPKLKKLIEDKKLAISYAEMEWVAKDETVVDENTQSQLNKMLEALEENDDVSDYFTNAQS